jgi:hypothetical protein
MSRIADLARSAADLTSEIVHVPEWDVDIEIRSMDGHQRAHYLQRLGEARDAEDRPEIFQTELELVTACSFDPDDGTQIFTDNDAEWLFGKSGRVIGRLASAALRVSGLAADSEEKAGKGSSD